MGRLGGTADSLLKQTFRLSPRSGGGGRGHPPGMGNLVRPTPGTTGWRKAIRAGGTGESFP